ncbi:MAG: GNAT family N-acetyltransferase [Rhodobacterales bacterium]|nr:MAG: GNAT family N-acetyltransferase [Rhodobacterales bacterium]
MLNPGFHDVPEGHVAAVVTYLEMRARPELRAEVEEGLSLRRVESPDATWYQSLFRAVGAEDWLWFSRLAMSEAALCDIIQHPEVAIYVLERGGREEGLLELDFRTEGECELAFFGVTRALTGTGAGRWMMNRAIELAWARPITRFHVHTCTLDHPAALPFYMRSGFTPLKREVEIAPDPRLGGLIDKAAAPQIPTL